MFENGQNDMNNIGSQYENQAVNDNYSVSGVESVTKKGKGKKAAVIGGISAAVLVGGGATAYGVSDTVKNQVKLRTNSPEKYYAWVTEKNSKSIGETFSEYYKKGLDKYEKGQSSSIKVSFEPTNDTKELVLQEIFGYDYEDELKGEEKDLADIIRNNDKYAISLDSASKKGNLSSNVGLELNGSRVVGADIVMDNDAMDYFVRIPELKDQWLGIEYGKYMDELVEDVGLDRNPTSVYKEILKDPESFLSPEELETEINRYAGVWSNFAKDVELEKKEEVDICDITVNYTVATVDLTEKDIAKLGLEMLKELRSDSIIKDIVDDKLDVLDEDEFEEDLDEAIDSLKERIKDGDYDNDETVLSIDTYIDATGTIRGLQITQDDTTNLMVIGKDGDSIRGEFTAKSGKNEIFSAKLSAEEDHKKYTGDIEIEFPSVGYRFDEDSDSKKSTVSILFEDVEIVDEEKGYFNGDFTINIADYAPIVINCDADKDGQSIGCDINISGTNYGRLGIDYSIKDKADVDIPDKGGAFMIDPADARNIDIEDYASKSEVESFVKGVMEKAGLKSSTAGDLAKEIAGEIFNDFDYDLDFDDDDWDDDDWDDFDWDDDDDDDEDDQKTTSSSIFDDDDDYEFDPSQFKYEDYKDYMTEEEFNDWMKLMEELMKEAQ